MRHTPLGLLLLAASEAAPSFWRLKQAHLVSEPECEVADECSEPWEVTPQLVPREITRKDRTDYTTSHNWIYPEMNTQPARCVSSACREGRCSYGKCCCSRKDQMKGIANYGERIDAAIREQEKIRRKEVAAGGTHDARLTWCAPGRCGRREAAEPSSLLEPEKTTTVHEDEPS